MEARDPEGSLSRAIWIVDGSWERGTRGRNDMSYSEFTLETACQSFQLGLDLDTDLFGTVPVAPVSPLLRSIFEDYIPLATSIAICDTTTDLGARLHWVHQLTRDHIASARSPPSVPPGNRRRLVPDSSPESVPSPPCAKRRTALFPRSATDCRRA